MDVLASTGMVLWNFSRVQSNEQKDVSALASGLRIQSAADDPSGLAIAESIHARVSGMQQGVQNVQNANNLLTVADSALSSVQKILQRVHSLIVQSRSDLASIGDLNSIQTEIDSLLHEINQISSNANFNGIRLFDGSLDTSPGGQSSTVQITSEPNPDGSAPSSIVSNADGLGNPGNLVSNASVGSAGGVASLIEFRVTGYSTNPVDPITGPLGQPGVYVQTIVYSSEAAFGAAPETIQVTAVPTNAGAVPGLFITSPSGTKNVLGFDLANLTQADVGTAMTFLTTLGPDASGGHALHVNSGGTEGADVSISLPTVSSAALSVAGISVLPPGLVDAFNNPAGQAGSNMYAADAAEARTTAALQSISAARAQVGSQSVSLQEDSNNASIDIVNQTASESAIRDLNIGAATTQFTKDQVLSSVCASVLAQMNTNARQLTHLLLQTL